MAMLSSVQTGLDRPPVTEMMLGVQFAPILNFTSGHFGRYWKDTLGDRWVSTQEVPALPDQFEKFGNQIWNIPGLPPFVSMGISPNRLQFMRKGDDRVIQIQNSRFVYNWRKRDNEYPRFSTIYNEFSQEFDKFQEFLRTENLEDVSVNQWEVTYINQVPKGTIWNSPLDWGGVFPGLLASPHCPDGLLFDGQSGDWRFEIAPQRGRLHASLKHAKDLESGIEMLVLNLTARGPLDESRTERAMESVLTLGHDLLIDAFASFASQKALAYWGG